MLCLHFLVVKRRSQPVVLSSRSHPIVLAPHGGVNAKPRSRLSASCVAVCQQGIHVEYSVEYSKCRALKGILVSTVDDCRLLN
eukprot:8069492-Pyramimonas_sp.AAC.1